jgi:CRP/FNR family transcriptional regulator
MKIAKNFGKRMQQEILLNIEALAKKVGPTRPCSSVHSRNQFAKGEQISGPYDPEQRVFLIKEGEVEIYQLSPKGKKVIMDILGPGDLFGNSPFSPEPYLESNDFAAARSRTTLIIGQKSDFADMLEAIPELAISLIGEMSMELNEADSRIMNLALSNAKTRLVNELLRIGKSIGEENDGNLVIGTKLTHEELAEMTGITRETVCRVLKKLCRDKIIALDKFKRIAIDKQKARDSICGF